jgi:hypothetical protein
VWPSKSKGNPYGITSDASLESVMNSPRSVMPMSSRCFGQAQTIKPWYTSSAVTSQRPQNNSSTLPPGMPRLFLCSVAPRWPLVAMGGAPTKAINKGARRGATSNMRGQSGDHCESWSPLAAMRAITTRMLMTPTRSLSQPPRVILCAKHGSPPITSKNFSK